MPEQEYPIASEEHDAVAPIAKEEHDAVAPTSIVSKLSPKRRRRGQRISDVIGPLVINVSARDVGEGGEVVRHIDIDKSYNEILNAVMAGRKILFVWPIQGDDSVVEAFGVAELHDINVMFGCVKRGTTVIYSVKGLGILTYGIDVDALYATSPNAPFSTEMPEVSQDNDSAEFGEPSFETLPDVPGGGAVQN